MRLNKKPLFDFLNRSKGSYFANKKGLGLLKNFHPINKQNHPEKGDFLFETFP